MVQASSGTLAPDLKSALKIQAQVHAERNEMLFAQRVLFVEGQTERIAMPFVFEALGIDANREGITVVDCDGKTAIPFFVQLAKSFGIPFVAMADLDPSQDQKATENIRKVCSVDELVLLDPDFEGVSGYAASKREKTISAYHHFDRLDAEKIPEPIRKAVERLLQK